MRLTARQIRPGTGLIDAITQTLSRLLRGKGAPFYGPPSRAAKTNIGAK